MLLICSVLSAQVRRDFTNVEKLFLSGKVSQASNQLSRLKPSNNEERAFTMYYAAFQKTSSSEALNQYLATSRRHPKTKYGQLAMLEAAKIYILERDMDSAQAQLRGIYSPDIIERYYWLACINFYNDEYSAAIANSDNYLRLAPKGKVAEPAAHIIVESYLMQKKYQSAISALSKVRQLPSYDRQYYHFKQGYAHEMNGNYGEALKSYQKGYELDKYSQSAFSIEERLFAMRSKNASLDISFLYPYEPLEIVEAEEELIVENNDNNQKEEPEVKEEKPLPELPPLIPALPEKITQKPSSGLYIQAGRFSLESNASRLVANIRKMEVNASYLEERKDKDLTWVVLAGPFADRDQAESVRLMLKDKDIDSFLTRF
ncbi:MAG TPA: tetratricopeptide repeat protein [Candidatus Cloacimonetes bacterium]|nr:tetratricopeptide repeat protein [Candidatus Cloacimonadota bacterium]